MGNTLTVAGSTKKKPPDPAPPRPTVEVVDAILAEIDAVLADQPTAPKPR